MSELRDDGLDNSNPLVRVPTIDSVIVAGDVVVDVSTALEPGGQIVTGLAVVNAVGPALRGSSNLATGDVNTQGGFGFIVPKIATGFVGAGLDSTLGPIASYNINFQLNGDDIPISSSGQIAIAPAAYSSLVQGIKGDIIEAQNFEGTTPRSIVYTGQTTPTNYSNILELSNESILPANYNPVPITTTPGFIFGPPATATPNLQINDTTTTPLSIQRIGTPVEGDTLTAGTSSVMGLNSTLVALSADTPFQFGGAGSSTAVGASPGVNAQIFSALPFSSSSFDATGFITQDSLAQAQTFNSQLFNPTAVGSFQFSPGNGFAASQAQAFNSFTPSASAAQAQAFDPFFSNSTEGASSGFGPGIGFSPSQAQSFTSFTPSVVVAPAPPPPPPAVSVATVPDGFQSYLGNYFSTSYQPVVLDLAGKGIKITPLTSSNSFYNLSNDGYQHRTAWAGAGNAVLFIDPNNTGKITEANQVIFTDWDPTAKNDMQALEDVFDTNHDGKLDAGDAAFSQFKLMVTNADGTTSVETLAQAGITSIDLNANSVNQSFTDGSSIDGETTFTKSDGTTGTAATVTFAADANGYAVKTTTTHNADGSTTIDNAALNADGSLANETISTTSADGLSRTISYDDAGNGIIDHVQSDVTVDNADGSTTETLSNRNGAGVLENQTITTTSADGVFDLTSVDATVVNADGSGTETVTDTNADGSLHDRSVTMTSASAQLNSMRSGRYSPYRIQAAWSRPSAGQGKSERASPFDKTSRARRLHLRRLGPPSAVLPESSEAKGDRDRVSG